MSTKSCRRLARDPNSLTLLEQIRKAQREKKSVMGAIKRALVSENLGEVRKETFYRRLDEMKVSPQAAMIELGELVDAGRLLVSADGKTLALRHVGTGHRKIDRRSGRVNPKLNPGN